jgi:PBP superfamily domain
MRIGLCREPNCAKAAGAEPIEIYPGPGEYCPECGGSLEPAGPPERELISREAYQQAHDRMMASLGPPPPPRRPGRAVVVAALAGAAVVAGLAFALLRPVAAGRAGADTVRVCTSSITERLARDVVRSYAAASGTPAARFGSADASGGCDVRFAARAGTPAGAIAHDGIVAVVNPQNGIARLSEDQVRRIFTGGPTDWAQAGGKAGAIVVLLPDDATDEVRALTATLLHGAKPGGGVRRLPTSADVVRTVAGASGRNAIGLVAFSAAVPAKVLALGSAPAPSVLSIAEHRYPLALAITVEPEGSPPGAAAGLVDYAHSDQAQAIVVRDGLVAKKGF